MSMFILGKEKLRRRRTAPGTRGTDGRFVAGAETVTPFEGSVQPAPGQVLEILTEGERKRGARVLFTTLDLVPTSQDDKTLSDVVERVSDGTLWEVHINGEWPKLLNHHQVTLIRIAEPNQ